jgi:RNA polymerase sigma-70 factor (ECF subfamily)
MDEFRRGAIAAFEVLLRRHRTAVFNFILRFTGNRALAEDRLQDTWLRVVRHAAEYRPKARFTTWLYTIARNQCVDAKRKEAFRKTESLHSEGREGEDNPAPIIDRLPAPGISPERDLHNARIRDCLETALSSLPSEQREVFLLREYNGMSFKEIAEITSTPENTVKSRMRYALEGLRRQLIALGMSEDMAEETQAAG